MWCRPARAASHIVEKVWGARTVRNVGIVVIVLVLRRIVLELSVLNVVSIRTAPAQHRIVQNIRIMSAGAEYVARIVIVPIQPGHTADLVMAWLGVTRVSSSGV